MIRNTDQPRPISRSLTVHSYTPAKLHIPTDFSARGIADELTRKGVSLCLGASVYDPRDSVGRLLFNVPGMVAEFEADLIR